MSLSELTNTLTSATGSLPPEIDGAERESLLAALDKLRDAVESPMDRAMRIMLGGFEQIILNVAVDMNLFDTAMKFKSESRDITVDALAKELKADPLLMTRIMRLLAGMKYFEETSPNQFVALPRAQLHVTGSPLREGVLHMHVPYQVLANLPDYLASNNYTNPSDAYDGPFQYALKTDQHCFTWLSEHPRLQNAFNVIMSMNIRFGGHDSWYQFYPVTERLQVSSPEDVVMVDIGGGIGHDLAAFRKEFPNLSGRMIVQDLDFVVEDALKKGLPEGIEAMAQDFFEPQQVKGAKAYYFRTVIHDWPDKQARVMLKHIHDAMNDDSLLFINEHTLPESHVPLRKCYFDLIMMANFAALERSEQQFKELLESADFELLNVWKAQGTNEEAACLFEARKKR